MRSSTAQPPRLTLDPCIEPRVRPTLDPTTLGLSSTWPHACLNIDSPYQKKGSLSPATTVFSGYSRTDASARIRIWSPPPWRRAETSRNRESKRHVGPYPLRAQSRQRSHSTDSIRPRLGRRSGRDSTMHSGAHLLEFSPRRAPGRSVRADREPGTASPWDSKGTNRLAGRVHGRPPSTL